MMNRVVLRLRYPPDYHLQDEPSWLPLGLFNDLLQELQNISSQHLPLNQELDPTSIALELKVRDKTSQSGPKEVARKQKVESGIDHDKNRNTGEDEKDNESKVEDKPADWNDPASFKKSLKIYLINRSYTMLSPKLIPKHSLLSLSIQTRELKMAWQVSEQSRCK